MTFRIKAIIVAATLFITGFVANAFAANQIIDSAKSNCIVGEQINGYLGAVPGGAMTSEIEREMLSVNLQRKALYAREASENGVTVEQFAKLTAEKLINGAPSGHCVQNASGDWVTKP